MMIEIDFSGMDEDEAQQAILDAREAYARLLMDMGESYEVAFEKADYMVESICDWIEDMNDIEDGIRNN